MIIKFGGIVSDGRGSIGGVVFSRNAAGAYAKQRTVPTYPATDRQQNVASLLSTIIADWKVTLSTAQRAAWNVLASNTSLPNKLGEMFTPSGLNLFVKANMLLDQTGQGHVTVPPVAAVCPSPQFTFAYQIDPGIEVTSIGNWDNSPDGLIAIQSIINLPLSQNYYKGPYAQTWTKTFAGFDVLPMHMIATASLVANTRAHFRVRAVQEDGAVSAAGFYAADVGAVV